MKIIIDIGHPAHVHYFRNFIKIMEDKGHSFLIIAKDRNITYELLDHYKIPFIKRKDYPSSLLGKLLNIPITDLFVIKHAKKFKPDIMIGFSGTHIAHAGKVLNIPSIVIDDTEHATLAHWSYKPFASVILTPRCFYKELGSKQIYFDSYTEYFYLHPNYFEPNPKVLSLLNINEDEDFAIVRFVAWNASHDVNENGLSNNDKIDLIKYLSAKMKVFISSEGDMPLELQKNQFSIPSEYMHDALSYARLYVGEGGTTASESAIIGTPAIYMNNLSMGYINDEKEAGLLYQTAEINKIKEYIETVVSIGKKGFTQKRDNLLKDKIDPTAFLIWFVENYPRSVQTMKNNSDYQYRFK